MVIVHDDLGVEIELFRRQVPVLLHPAVIERPIAIVPITRIVPFVHVLPYRRLRQLGVLQGVLRNHNTRNPCPYFDSANGGIAQLHQLRTAIGRLDGERGSHRVPGSAQMTAHASHGKKQLGQIGAAAITRRSVIVQQHDIARLAHLSGIPGNVFNRSSAYFGSPFAGFRNTIVFPKNIRLKILIDNSLSGHALGVKPHCASMKEVPVDNVALLVIEPNHLIGNCQQKRRISAGTHPHPPRLENAGRHIVLWPHVNELRPCFFCKTVIVHRIAGAVPRRVHTIKHNGICVF